MSAPVVEVKDVSVRYGRRVAVQGASLNVSSGSVYALLGRNGAGKSSLVRCILGQVRADRGEVSLFGEDVWKHRVRLMEKVGVVAEDPDAPSSMRIDDLGRFNARLYARWQQTAYDARLRRFGIAPDSRFGNLSKGQKKQVSLALTLAAAPELVVLDDPTLGLDVVARKSLFEEVIADMADRGISVLITTHDLAPVEAIADRVGILREGRVVLDEEVEALKSRFRRIRVAAQPVSLASAHLITTSMRQWGTSGTDAVVSNYDDLALERFRAEANVTPEVTPMTLEEIFIAVAGEQEGA